MATKKTNKKTKQNTSKKTSSNRQKTADRADAIRVSEIATVAVSVILFCLAIVSGNGVWNVLHNVYVGIFGMLILGWINDRFGTITGAMAAYGLKGGGFLCLMPGGSATTCRASSRSRAPCTPYHSAGARPRAAPGCAACGAV